MAKGRNKAEFTATTKRTLAGRAGYRCSFPGCRLFLIGPHSDGESTKGLSVAAHIRGAAPGSARYDKDQTDEDRKNISNGIWLCWNHSVQIDNDEEMYSVEQLHEWKSIRESEAAEEFGKAEINHNIKNVVTRPNKNHRLDTDGKFRRNGFVVSFDAYKTHEGTLTNVQLSVEGEINSLSEMPEIAVLSVQSYLTSVGLRGNYLHIMAQMRNHKLHPLSQNYLDKWKTQFGEFKERYTSMDWGEIPGMEGAVFDLIAGDVEGTGEWSDFMIDITCLYPDIYSEHIDKLEETD